MFRWMLYLVVHRLTTSLQKLTTWLMRAVEGSDRAVTCTSLCVLRGIVENTEVSSPGSRSRCQKLNSGLCAHRANDSRCLLFPVLSDFRAGVVTRLRAEVSEVRIPAGVRFIFSKTSRAALGLSRASYFFSSRLKRPEREADHSSQCGVETEWSNTSISPVFRIVSPFWMIHYSVTSG